MKHIIFLFLFFSVSLNAQRFRHEIQDYSTIQKLRDEFVTPTKNDKVFVVETAKLYWYDNSDNTSVDDSLNVIVQGGFRWKCVTCGAGSSSVSALHDIRIVNSAIERGSDSAIDPKGAQYLHNNYSHLDGYSDNWISNTAVTNPVITFKSDVDANNKIAYIRSGDLEVNGVTVGRGNNNISNNTAVGYSALNSITSGNQSVAIGFEALKNATNTGLNTAVGYRAMASTVNPPAEFPGTISNFTVAVGYAALEASIGDTDNTAVGYAAMRLLNGGDFNTGIGYASLGNAVTARDNTALGWRSLGSLTSGYSNTGIGYNNLGNNQTGFENCVVGYECFNGVGNAFYNTAIGYRVAKNGTGSRNTGIGWRSLDNLTSGEWNTVIGAYSGGNITDASRCTIIGANVVADSPSAYSEIYIGDGAGNVRIKHNGGRLKFPDFGAGTQTGTQTYNLQVTSNGSIIETKAIPNPPTTDGTYTLVCTVTGGVASYTWVSN